MLGGFFLHSGNRTKPSRGVAFRSTETSQPSARAVFPLPYAYAFLARQGLYLTLTRIFIAVISRLAHDVCRASSKALWLLAPLSVEPKEEARFWRAFR